MSVLPIAVEHAIQRLAIERTPQGRSFSVALVCVCGTEYPGAIAADLSGTLEVGIQMFFSHLAAASEEAS